jgi:aspartate kinase
VDARRCVVTDEAHGGANPLAAETERATRAELSPLLKAGVTPVLGGFIALSRTGAPTTLGRGGSDYSATLVGAALAAREVQIWTDVDGVLTADPRLVPGAQTVSHLSYAEAAELAHFGAKVLHPKTVQPAGERDIPIHVCNSRRPVGTGTLIGARVRAGRPAVKAVAHRAARELEGFGPVECAGRRAVVCVVGEGLSAAAGVGARALDALGDVPLHGLRLSGVSLTFVVDEEEAPRVVARLHETFFGAPEPRATVAGLARRESFQPAFLHDACPEPSPL